MTSCSILSASIVGCLTPRSSNSWSTSTSGKREHSHRLWSLLMLELWFRRHFDSRPTVGSLL